MGFGRDNDLIPCGSFADDSFCGKYIEKELARLEEAKRQSTMSLAEEIQQAEERHANGQLTDAELEVMRIKIAAEEEFNNLQINDQAVEEGAQEKIERLLAKEAREVGSQSSKLPQANEQEVELS